MGTKRTLSVGFAADSEDFISRECGGCHARFKAAVVEGGTTVRFCPFCGCESDRWETPEQLRYAKEYAAKTVMQPALEQFDRAMRRLSRSGGRSGVRGTGRVGRLPTPRRPVEGTEEMRQRSTFGCCGEVLRHDATRVALCCPVCGAAAA